MLLQLQQGLDKIQFIYKFSSSQYGGLFILLGKTNLPIKSIESVYYRTETEYWWVFSIFERKIAKSLLWPF
jgi:hypothetical protein